MKNFTCPNCKAAATLKEIVPNKKLREIVSWFKELTNDNTINIQNQYAAGSQINNPFSSLNSSYLNNLKGFVSAKPNEGFATAASTASVAQSSIPPTETGKLAFISKESLIDEKLNLLKSQTIAKSSLTPTGNEKESLNAQPSFGSDEKNKSFMNVNLKAINPNNLFSNHENNVNKNVSCGISGYHEASSSNPNASKTGKKIVGELRKESFDNEKPRISEKFRVTDQINDINKIEFKKESNMTPEEKMQLYNKINSDSSVTGSMRKHSEEINESFSQKGTASNF